MLEIDHGARGRDAYAGNDLGAEHGAGEPGNGDHNDCTAGNCVVPDEKARQASNCLDCQDEQRRAENHGCSKAADRREWADGAPRNLMPSSNSVQSITGSNGRARIAKKPISRVFIRANKPRASPRSVATTGLAFAGRTSRKATPSSASSGTLTNAPGVRRLNSFGASSSKKTSKQASALTRFAAKDALRRCRRCRLDPRLGDQVSLPHLPSCPSGCQRRRLHRSDGRLCRLA
jgi:hypothetical protein